MPVDALPAAFSVPSQVETIGALAGLAAILGLAVLSMLYFAQARELKRLREWAGRAPERAAELQERAMATPVPRRVTPQPVPGRPAQARPVTPVPTPRPPGAPAAGTPAAATGGTPGATAPLGTPAVPSAPTPPGTGKPATAAATAAAAGTATPTTAANGQTAAPGEATPADAATEADKDPTETPAADGRPPATGALDDTAIGQPPTDDDTGEQPTTAQGPIGPDPKPSVPQPLPVPPSARAAAGARPATPAARTSAAPGPRPRAAAPLRTTNPSATIPPRGGGSGTPPADRDGDGGGNRGLRIGLVVGAVVLVIAAGVFAFTQLTGGDDSPAGSTTPAKTATADGNTISPAAGAKTSTQEAPQPRGDTTVAVLNGTTVPGLARTVADKLLAAGYKIGTVTNAPDQQRSATQVAYQRGQERVARQVARTIDVGSDAVTAIDEVTEATAGSDALIVVTVGADQSP